MQGRCSLAKIPGKKCNFLPERLSQSLPIQIRHIKILRLRSRQTGSRFGMHIYAMHCEEPCETY